MDSRHGKGGPNLRFLTSQQSGYAELGSFRLGLEVDSSWAVSVKGCDVGVGFLGECLTDWIDGLACCSFGTGSGGLVVLTRCGWPTALLRLLVRLQGLVRSRLEGIPGVLEIERVRDGCARGRFLIRLGLSVGDLDDRGQRSELGMDWPGE